LIASPRETGCDWSSTTSRVFMLGEASQKTTTVGFSSGRNSSIHSG
jgi:hypothetical protein